MIIRLPTLEQFVNESSDLIGSFLRYITEAKIGIGGPPDRTKIEKAIKNRNYVGIYYEDPSDPDVLAAFRLIEPYAYGKGYSYKGKTTHPDTEYLRAFVIKDSSKDNTIKGKFTRRKSGSKSQRVPYWRLFKVENITDWVNLGKKFSGYREFYNPDDSMISDIFASVSIEEFPKGEQKLKIPRDLRKSIENR